MSGVITKYDVTVSFFHGSTEVYSVETYEKPVIESGDGIFRVGPSLVFAMSAVNSIEVSVAENQVALEEEPLVLLYSRQVFNNLEMVPGLLVDGGFHISDDVESPQGDRYKVTFSASQISGEDGG